MGFDDEAAESAGVVNPFKQTTLLQQQKMGGGGRREKDKD